jgi:hypothetical protein
MPIGRQYRLFYWIHEICDPPAVLTFLRPKVRIEPEPAIGECNEAAADHPCAMASTAVALVTLPIVLHE